MSKLDELNTNNEGVRKESPVFLHSLHLQNILSFGSEMVSVELGPLNIFIGPNGSGKSNFIEAINLLRASPRNLEDFISKGYGVQEWVWKGKHAGNSQLLAVVASSANEIQITHNFEFNLNSTNFALSREVIYGDYYVNKTKSPIFFFRNESMNLMLRNKNNEQVPIHDDNFSRGDSILAQRKDPEQYPEITYLSDQYSKIRIYSDWVFGKKTIFRGSQPADMRTLTLEEDFSNLGLFLNRLRRLPKAKQDIFSRLQDLYAGRLDFDVSVEASRIQIFFTEGEFVIPAGRLSDGTLRYLCLLAILCDPTPPPLICIEEPELGLHPDIIVKIADLLVEASSRTQLIVTTHSEILIDAMTERPEVVKIFEKNNGRTQIKSLSKEDLSIWLQKYRLGELWMSGQLGGTRW